MGGENKEAPSLDEGKVTVEIEPDLRKLRSFLLDLTALIDNYWPESAHAGETDGSARSPEEPGLFTARRIF